MGLKKLPVVSTDMSPKKLLETTSRGKGMKVEASVEVNLRP